jgi:hypothetical protein
MSTELRLRRGTTTQHSTFIGAPAEVTVDTSRNQLVVNDGVTAGGHKVPTMTDLAAKANTASLGTAATANLQTAATDTTAGAVLTVGAFGLGATNQPFPGSLDTLQSTGHYNWNNVTPGAPAPGHYGSVSHINYSTADATQTAISQTLDKCWFRKRIGSIWGAWKVVLTSGDQSSLDVGKVGGFSPATGSSPTWPGLAVIDAAGGMEVGNMIDFHGSSNDGVDNVGRIRYENGHLNMNAGSIRINGEIGLTQPGHDRMYLFREGRIDSVNANNSAWSGMTLRGNDFYFKSPADVNKFSVDNTQAWFFGTGARSGTGAPIVCNNSSVGRVFRTNGALEWDTDIGAVGTSYFLSDERKKQNIAPTEYGALSAVNQMDFIQFDWRPDSGMEGHVDLGVTAQQLQTINPDYIHTLSDGGLNLNTNQLLMDALKAIQELSAQVSELQQISKGG